METTITLNTAVCRICEETNYLINLFEQDNAHLFEKLKEIENIPDTSDNVLFDSMFKYICTSCENSIEATTCGIIVQPQETFIILDEVSERDERIVIDETASESSVELIENSDSIEMESNSIVHNYAPGNSEEIPLKIVSVSGPNGTLTDIQNPKSILCTICNKKVSARTFDMHKARHEQKKIFECTECSKTFLSKRYWIAHLKDHMNVREYQCDQCEYSSMVPEELKAHQLSHSEDKGFVCQICEKAYHRYHNLKSHMQKVHGKDISTSDNT
ncbi:zinc finger and SCAN domain-containing protein 5C-like isoform X2 [Phlebotomus papatasi]|uniref:zinc finger and SCAN domain-containing protein 5C-like isoform X2 n=1 Tax=Phlebotomus papatasi TaxID=29031 RepID=UPI002483C559|nr:zinc finger and SCAN domain-containing protein 5C-like isoform X2 [Phlebotomus papatasi]